MKILFDTSVWIQHFRKGDNTLQEALENDMAITHPMVIGELVVGHLPETALKDLKKLEMLSESSWNEVIDFVLKYKLCGKGLSWVDVHLLHSCLAGEVHLVTYDKNLKQAYSRLS